MIKAFFSRLQLEGSSPSQRMLNISYIIGPGLDARSIQLRESKVKSMGREPWRHPVIVLLVVSIFKVWSALFSIKTTEIH